MLLPLGVLSVALEWGAVGRLRAGGACVGAAAKSSESGSGALLLLSKTPKAVVKEEFSPSIEKKSLSSSWRPETPSAVGLTISLTHLYLCLSEVRKMRDKKTCRFAAFGESTQTSRWR